jgi:hypothetical protein
LSLILIFGLHIKFYVGSGPNPVPECIMVPVPLWQKVAVPSVPVPAPVPQQSTLIVAM